MWPRLFSGPYTLMGWLALPVLWLLPKARRHILDVPTPSPGCIWVHGASAGEHKPLGHSARIEGALLADFQHLAHPIPDAFQPRWTSDRSVSAGWTGARPQMLILVEAELWPGWLLACRRRQIPVVLVNARHSRSMTRWKSLGLWQWLTQDLTVIPIEDIGDLKTAAPSKQPAFHINRPYLLAASTHPADETALLEAWEDLPNRPLLVIAPRRVERATDVLKRLSDHSAQLRSEWPLNPDTEVLILDRFGELASLYANAEAAFIGGTFEPTVGGHSPAEAISSGCAYVYGPHTTNNAVSFAQGNGIQVQASLAVLAAALLQAMDTTPQPLQTDPNKAVERLPEGRTPEEQPARPWLKPFAPLWVNGGADSRAIQPHRSLLPYPLSQLGTVGWRHWKNTHMRMAGGTGGWPLDQQPWLSPPQRRTGAPSIGRTWR